MGDSRRWMGGTHLWGMGDRHRRHKQGGTHLSKSENKCIQSKLRRKHTSRKTYHDPIHLSPKLQHSYEVIATPHMHQLQRPGCTMGVARLQEKSRSCAPSSLAIILKSHSNTKPTIPHKAAQPTSLAQSSTAGPILLPSATEVLKASKAPWPWALRQVASPAVYKMRRSSSHPATTI